MERTIFEEEHELFRGSVRRFAEKEIAPHHAQWEDDGQVPTSLWLEAGRHGFLGLGVPAEHGGSGVRDFRFNVVVNEELVAVGASGVGFGLLNDVVLPYLFALATEEQAARWYPGMVGGQIVPAIAMSEPGTGSDLAGVATTAIDRGDHYVVNGQKTFITNGILNNWVIVVARTDRQRPHGLSLLVVEEGMAGYQKGRRLKKVGMRAQDTAELFFNDVEVPKSNLLGEEGQGFVYLMTNLATERLSIAVSAVAGCEQVLATTLDYVTTRTAFGRPIGSFQNSRFRLAEMATEIEIARLFVDHCIQSAVDGSLDPVTAAKAKWWTTELQKRVVDTCVQLHGGYGYMLEYEVARAYVDTRAASIFGGTNEVMKELIGRSMGL